MIAGGGGGVKLGIAVVGEDDRGARLRGAGPPPGGSMLWVTARAATRAAPMTVTTMTVRTRAS